MSERYVQLDEDICLEEETVNCGFYVVLRSPLIALDVPLMAAQFLVWPHLWSALQPAAIGQEQTDLI